MIFLNEATQLTYINVRYISENAKANFLKIVFFVKFELYGRRSFVLPFEYSVKSFSGLFQITLLRKVYLEAAF